MERKLSRVPFPPAHCRDRNFRCFPEVLERAMSSPPSPSVAQRPIAIRPTSVILKKAASFESSDKVVSLTDDVSESIPSHSLYRPTARAVSRATASLLANLVNFDPTRREQPAAASIIQHPSQAAATAHHQNSSSSQFDRLNSVAGNSEAEARSQQQAAAGHDRPSYDGYNWRKYGQKQVKGSEYPRSYYKCTHPTCPVKKKVERSFDGQIAEIVYKGEHNHSKPQPPKRLPSTSQEQGFAAAAAAAAANEHGREAAGSNPAPWTATNSMLEIESLKEASLNGVSSYSPLADAVYDCNPNSTDGAAAFQALVNPSRAAVIWDHDRPDSKRRRCEDQASGTNSVGEASTDPQSVMQTTMESDVSGDGYHWRKYGQKVVRGNTYPRSYYKCTSPKCSVRKYVEKASDESGYFVTTYEGRHNHEMPPRKPNFAASNTDPAAAAALDSSNYN